MKDKFEELKVNMEKVIIIQGEELILGFEQSDDVNQFVVNNLHNTNIIGNILVKEFATIQEKKAYLQGFEDCEGWLKNLLIENKETEEIITLIKKAKIS